jgi:hypothetical protein
MFSWQKIIISVIIELIVRNHEAPSDNGAYSCKVLPEEYQWQYLKFLESRLSE